MTRLDYKDIAAGGLFIAGGFFFALIALAKYGLGTLNHMGPGMFPVIAGSLLVVLGLIILVPALLRNGVPLDTVEWRPMIAIILASGVFAATLERFGIIPATAALTFIATFADKERKMTPVGVAVFVAIVTALIALIFKIGLSIPVPLARWPF